MEAASHHTQQYPRAGDIADIFGKTYKNTSNGIVWIKTTRNKIENVQLTNFSAYIRSEIIEDDGADQRKLFEIVGHLHHQDYGCTVPAKEYNAMAWPIEKIGPEAIVNPGQGIKDRARAAIQELSGVVKSRIVYRHIGWRKIDGRWYYLHANGAIGTPRIEPEVSLDGRLGLISLPDTVDIEQQRRAVRASLRMLDVMRHRVTLLLWAAIWRVAMGGRVDFSIHVYGLTGEGKSELCALAQQHFGKGLDARNFPGSWSSTDNALEKASFIAKDCIFGIDDYTPRGSSYEVSAYKRKAERLFRSAGNKIGRERLRTDLTLRSQWYPRGLIVSSGEDLPEGQSASARILMLEIDRGYMDWDVLSPCQEDAAQGLYADAMAGFIQWFAPDYETYQEELQKRFNVHRAQFRASHARLPEIAANLSVGLEFFGRYARSIEAISEEEAVALLADLREIILESIEAQEQFQREENEGARFLQLLKGVLTSGKAHLENLTYPDQAPDENPLLLGWRQNRMKTDKPFDENSTLVEPFSRLGERVGWVEGFSIFLDPKASMHAVRRYASESGETFALSDKATWKRLYEGGYLASAGYTTGRRSATILKKVHGKALPILHVNMSELFGDGEPLEDSEPFGDSEEEVPF